ncbi:hypothetical protein DEU56DRAFT_538975 [Suillus clintonianus]|uniref:uncharacterized protein n=1 Tax=Suillus clintonianus TaxID=1904413 RepID=UPI001B867C43|nr:uncharacterized protein DEU56DRAFT_538975 [Suillus clintonianus]KAG2126590.1 hypothetical protein DEU56DRAFT_538975 [Suillus clintonianus]
MSSSPKPSALVINFPNSPIPKNPLGEGRYIKTAAALIIGDERCPFLCSAKCTRAKWRQHKNQNTNPYLIKNSIYDAEPC